MTSVKQRYYIAVPNKIENFGYQTIPTWKNYSFTGTFEDAKDNAIKLFKHEGLIDDYHILDELDDNTEKFNELYNNWDNLTEKEKDSHRKIAYDNILNFIIDEVNSGLILWDDICNEDKKNPFQKNLNVIEID